MKTHLQPTNFLCGGDVKSSQFPFFDKTLFRQSWLCFHLESAKAFFQLNTPINVSFNMNDKPQQFKTSSFKDMKDIPTIENQQF